jgi:hypothetical protein
MSEPPRIALATCRALLAGDGDDAGLPTALGGAEFVVWDDPAAGWDACCSSTASTPTPSTGARCCAPARSRRSTSSPRTRSAPLLLELELTEPSLFLAQAPGAAARFAAAMRARLPGH